jgi:hypothetical protein
MKRALIFAAVLVAVQAVAAQQAKDDAAWAPLRFLLGEWVGEGSGEPGQGTGGFSFQPDLQGKILVRRNYARYPASKDRPAYAHDDLLIVYAEPGRIGWQAVYFDNEGHVIHYAVSIPAVGIWEFLSEVQPDRPRYRLTYRKAGADTLTLKFEIAPPGKPEGFTSYIEARARRKASSH